MDRDCPQYVFQHYFKILYMVLTAYNVIYWFGGKPLTKNFKNFSLKTKLMWSFKKLSETGRVSVLKMTI